MKQLKTNLCKMFSSVSGALAVATGTVFSTFKAAETAIGTGLSNGGTKILEEISTVYCGSLVWPIFAISLFSWLLSKDDKKRGIAKYVCIGSIVLYIILKIVGSSGGGIIGQTLDTISSWVGGQGGQ